MFYLFIFEFLGTSETMLILVAALLLFGPRKLPQLSRSIGKSLAEFKRASQEFKDTWENEVTREVSDFQTVISGTALPATNATNETAHVHTNEQTRVVQTETALAESPSLLPPAPFAVSGADALAGDATLMGIIPAADVNAAPAPDKVSGSTVAASNHKRDWL